MAASRNTGQKLEPGLSSNLLEVTAPAQAMQRLLTRVQRNGGEAQSFAGLERYNSIQGHHQRCRYAQIIETHRRRTGSHLDAARGQRWVRPVMR